MNETNHRRWAVDELVDLGLTASEARCFVALVTVPKATATDVADLANLAPTEVDRSIDGLCEFGLVDVQEISPPAYRAIETGMAVRKLLREQRHRIDGVEAALSELEPEGKSDRATDIWTITGRRDVIDRGQAIVEGTDEELLLMCTTAGLFEEGCITRLQNAVDDGVSVLVGSPSSEVRNVVTERIPEVTVWEPTVDWLGLPVTDGMLGRLVMADREAVMVGSLHDERDSDTHREIAIWSCGTESGLVTTITQLLGSRVESVYEAASGRTDEPA